MSATVIMNWLISVLIVAHVITWAMFIRNERNLARDHKKLEEGKERQHQLELELIRMTNHQELPEHNKNKRSAGSD